MNPEHIRGLHHITLCTGTAQADIDFFVKVLGQRFVKRTLFYDGSIPIYHLYFADRLGTPGTVMTTFPTRRTGKKGRKGSNQFTHIAYSIPVDTIDWWIERLNNHGIETGDEGLRFGQRYVQFEHPDCGIGFEMIEDESDDREPFDSENVPIEYAQRGFHSWTCSVQEMEDMDEFMDQCWNFEKIGQEGNRSRYRVKDSEGPAKIIDIVHEPNVRQGSWTIAEGIIHHGAFEVPSLEAQARIKFETEGAGYTDFSDRKNRGYFESTYVRTPGGVMFEACHTLGFTHDEDEETLGMELKVSPQFDDRKNLIEEAMRDDPIVV